MMLEIILDTDYYAEFIFQYYDQEKYNLGEGQFIEEGIISKGLANKINRVSILYKEYEDPSVSGLVICSALSIVELSRKYNEIMRGRLPVEKLYDFIQYPPGWFLIAPVDMDLTPFFVDVPPFVNVEGTLKPMEWTDSIHVATLLSRGQISQIATNDSKIKSIPTISSRTI